MQFLINELKFKSICYFVEKFLQIMKTKRFISKKFIFLFTIIICWVGVYYGFGSPQEEKHQDNIEVTGHEQEVVQQQEHADEHAEEHGSNLSPLFFVILALIIGAATRQGLRKSPLPFTVGLLLIGIGLGVVARIGWFDTWSIGSVHINVKFLSNAVEWAGNIDPHVILFVFLPTLIFEAAFAMDVHTFKKSVGNASILAIPGILLAMILTATLAIGLGLAGIGLSGWGWPIALMFGAVVSATDPVAVVSLLKNLGASKKLGTLIEGESLLNDGTAIVLFMVFLAGITGEATGTSPIMEFFRVALGGILVGVIIGGVTINWVRRVFNDAMVEISVIIAAAYMTFYVCEHFLHVSGVLGLVTLGLVMASIGRTRISPEVEHFLHEFWELAAFIANTLIFLIVGVVIALRVVFSGNDFLILGIIYVGIHIIRAIVIAIFFPVMKRTGYGLSRKDSYVLWWGALRGAIGLALALIVANESAIPEEIRNQFLFLTAGIVTLTLLVNATTIGFLVNKLGLTKISPAKALMLSNANQYLRQSTENTIEKLKEDRFMGRANWKAVKDYLPLEEEKFDEQDLEIETIAETRRRVLEKEKSAYWHQFRDGLLGPVSVRRLSDGINDILDAGGMIPLSARKDLEESWKTPKLLNKMQSLPLFGKFAERAFFERLSISYESMGRQLKADSSNISKKEEEETLGIIEEEINENRIHGHTFLRNLRKSFPEIYSAVATRQAIRSMLNYERRTVERLHSPPSIDLPDAIELLKDVKWLQGLGPTTLDMIVKLFQTRVYSVGDKIIKESGHSDGFYFIARGTVKVTHKVKVLDVLSHGSFIGEMAGLTGLPRTAEVSAESPVTVLWMSSDNMREIMKESPILAKRLWRVGGSRLAENLLRDIEPYSYWRQPQLRDLLEKGKVVNPENEKDVLLKDKLVILLTGKAIPLDHEKKTYVGPALIENADQVEFGKNCMIFVC